MSQMETASSSKEEVSGPATYARGYQPLLQEDPEISVTHGPRNTVPEQPVVIQTLPPYTPEPQSSQYTPAPQSFNPQQQSSSVSKIIAIRSSYSTTCVNVLTCTPLTKQPYAEGEDIMKHNNIHDPHFPCQLHMCVI